MKKTALYLIFTFAITWAIWGAMALAPTLFQSTAGQMILSASMWVPALGVLLTWLCTQKQPVLHAGFRPRFRGHIRFYLAALFAPLVLTVLGGVLYFFIFPGQFDAGMSTFSDAMQASVASGQVTREMVPMLFAVQILSAVTVGPLFNTLFAIGEEIGWRGFLFPELRKKMSPSAANLLSGVIWGVWHTPINAMGHNYGLSYPGYPWLGIVAMCFFCVSIGIFFSWLTDKTGSIWPAALGHGAVNAVAAAPIYFLQSGTVYNPLLGPAMSGIITCIPAAVFAIVLLLTHFRRDQGRRESAPTV